MKFNKVNVGRDSYFIDKKESSNHERHIPENEKTIGNKEFNAFISFPTESEEFAEFIKQFIVMVFPDLHPVFISSSPDCIPMGSDWLNNIEVALKSTKIHFVLASKKSMSRPWINFEIGTTWFRKIPIVFLCYGDLAPTSLPHPYITKQAIALTRNEPEKGLRTLIDHLSRTLGYKHAQETDLKYCSQKLKQHLNHEHSIQ